MLEWLRKLKILWLGSSCKIHTPVLDSMVVKIEEIHRGIQEVKKDLARDKKMLQQELKKRDAIIQAMIESLPDMLWFKDTKGRYLYANKAIREGLLFSNNPIGETDAVLSKAAKARFGEKEHTFGDVCKDSDKDVLENKYTARQYVESGKIKGQMLHLEVNKSIVEIDGEVIGVVGSGRDITEYREELIKNGDIDVFEKNEFINKDQ